MTNNLNILFLCSRNQWRSPTAETIWRKHPGIFSRSGGLSPQAKHRVSHLDIQWANIIFVMEESHKKKLKSIFGKHLVAKNIHVLDIPDLYRYMDPELINLLQESVTPVLESYIIRQSLEKE